MIFQFYFKKMSSSEFLKDLSKKKLTDIVERYVGLPGNIHMTFQHVKSEHTIQCRLQSGIGPVVHATGTSDNMYAAVDLIAHKIEAQLARHKLRAQKKSRIHPLNRLPRSSYFGELAQGGLYRDEDESRRARGALH